MFRIMTWAVAASLLAAPAAAEELADRAPPPKKPSLMTPTEIEAYNKGLGQTHPYYIKCRKTLEIGSLVKKTRVCHAKAAWRERIARGNQDARDTAEAMTSKGSTSN